MHMLKPASWVIAAAMAFAMPSTVLAAEGDASLRVDQGKVLVSQGAEFTAVEQSPVSVKPGDRIMLTDGAAATLIFSADCQRKYSRPGVYPVERDCGKAAPVGIAKPALIALGVAAVAVAVSGGGGDNDNDDTPVSR
jgi:hypothetical protein